MPDSFDDAVATFREFLQKTGFPKEIVWLSAEDAVLVPGRVLYLKPQAHEVGVALARERYETGMARKLGVLFAALCKLGDATCCFVWVPSDADEAQRSLMPKSGGLKLRVPNEEFRLSIKRIRNSLYWKILQARHRDESKLRDFLFS